mmetsp:Transcript_21049/g.30404  ORF Transcript_21049/g.30404 Transcript_21049/m.30404 type:complete len:1233 (+) Transcript_21049:106-3804(+)|eukprot:CAMPEP_0185032348 /NCGR_PEP_ID=MMETSP1103-20130426/20326_1 /TAXON_ID=36769 /ORGANISM="Paraphysomonas bandaiensis, Strain Caron Lab Isolate" /LENGTH=1232 /DNA_ID=CAMNT_0027568201 /DNA_START=48 /DNA_END=3746 /DNA_ORIENTATION=-
MGRLVRNQCSCYRVLIVLVIAINIVWVLVVMSNLLENLDRIAFKERYSPSVHVFDQASSLRILHRRLGVDVREHGNLDSRPVGFIPCGALVVVDYKIQFLREVSPNSSERSLSWVYISFPQRGWVPIEFLGSSTPPIGGAAVSRNHPIAQLEEHMDIESLKSTNDRSSTVLSWNMRTPNSSRPMDSSSWLDQIPVGNGRIGALVGGGIDGEVIPISMAGFYVRQKRKGQSSVVGSSNFFRQSRELLMQGKVQESARILSKTISSDPLGMFQYICDLVVVFFPGSGKSSSSTPTSVPQHLLKPPPVRMSMGGRDNLLNSIKKILSVKRTYGEPEYARRTLDTATGLASTVQLGRSENGKDLHFHSREWFASAVDSVIVGDIKCREVDSALSKGCVHAGIALGREMTMNGPNVKLGEKHWRTVRWSDRIDYNIELTEGRVYGSLALSLSLRNVHGDTTEHEGAEVCGVLRCIKDNHHSAYVDVIKKSGEKVIWCSDADQLVIVLSVLPGNYSSDFTDESSAQDSHIEGVRRLCWNIVEQAVELGVDQLRYRHVKWFSERMSSTTVRLHPFKVSPLESGAKVCEDVTISSQLACMRNPALRLSHPSIARLMSSSFWFSKYLLLSSSSVHVSNLQGLWADGPTSAWNGDYHLNINLQMTYWPSHGMGIHGTVGGPLVEFIRRLAKAGEVTARELYACRGWVAHGFTDDKLNTGIRGNLEWALCVTCGAWLALHLWEHLIYTYNTEFLHSTFLPVYRSLLIFYLDYMFEGSDGIMHTGPTTSPENSFELHVGEGAEFVNLSKGSRSSRYQQLALSPAIDMAVLRQVSNAFSLAVDWCSREGSGSNNQLEDDHNLARRFRSMIQRTRNKANPIVDERSGLVVEYPFNQWIKLGPPDVTSSTHNRTTDIVGVNISETFDLGHRHFSSLLWIFPGTFLPKGRGAGELYEAAQNTLAAKISAGGGHTGWSAAWEMCLWARLRENSGVWNATTKVLSKYSADNLLGLHPPLKQWNKECPTCFKEKEKSVASGLKSGGRLVHSESSPRGMIDKDGAVFQIDTNMGYAAGVLEMVLQSYDPGVVMLLPSLPKEISHSGSIVRGVCRGGVKVSMTWENGKVIVATLEISQRNPWLEGVKETSRGYFRARSLALSEAIQVTLVAPNPIYSHRILNSVECFSDAVDISQHAIPTVSKSGDNFLFLQITSFPCTILVCADSLSAEVCSNRVKELRPLSVAMADTHSQF